MNIKPYAHLVILTGAGISKESGIETFRDGEGGLWAQHKIEDVCTPEGFARDPKQVHDFYNARRKQLLNQGVKPNSAHTALKRLQDKWPGQVTLVTQNIDNLHEQAGSQNVIHMHGELMRLWCGACDNRYGTTGDSALDTICLFCAQTGQVRPDIVWFGEMPYHMDRIDDALLDADLFIAIGTSGVVYPAAGFCQIARHHGADALEINLEPSAQAGYFRHGLYGPASIEVPRFVDRLLQEFAV